MKSLILLGLLFSFNSYALEVCNYRDTTDFFHALKSEAIKPIKVSKNPKRFTFIEKQMIHLTVTLRDWLSGTTKDDALVIFGEKGNVRHFEIDGRHFALALYYPNGVEHGAYYELRNSSYRLIAEINDGHIICK